MEMEKQHPWQSSTPLHGEQFYFQAGYELRDYLLQPWQRLLSPSVTSNPPCGMGNGDLTGTAHHFAMVGIQFWRAEAPVFFSVTLPT